MLHLAAALLGGVLLVPDAPGVDPAPLVIPPDAPELARNPALRGRLAASPHAYFRGIGPRFTSLLCERFGERAAALPTVTLHGDAHLEQYAVTDHGRGLTDFDDSTTGSALVDLARFATSIQLAARERGFSGDAFAIAAFLRGYDRGLEEPRAVAAEPAIARELRRGFQRDRLASLARAEALMTELPPDDRPTVPTLERIAALLANEARRPAYFFRVKKIGTLGIGIGSAADERYLFRIEGGSSKENDDVILELKEVRVLPTLSCLQEGLGPTRIIVAQATLAYEPFSYVGALSLEGRHYWFHAWPDNYAELRISALPSPQALQEVAYDVGVQLGRGHVRQKRKEDERRLQRELRAGLPVCDLGNLSAALADATEEAWRRFRRASGLGSP
ncbi:MAG TPA: DUF2252 family protein [Vicinamibacteria bacterium]|nr:DUF2252 family protein [Vicinamibacteria bacterium]